MQFDRVGIKKIDKIGVFYGGSADQIVEHYGGAMKTNPQGKIQSFKLRVQIEIKLSAGYKKDAHGFLTGGLEFTHPFKHEMDTRHR